MHRDSLPSSARRRGLAAILAIAALAALSPTPAGAQTTTLEVTNTQSHAVTVGLALGALGGACGKDHPPVKITEIAFCEPGTIIIPPNLGGYAGKCKFVIEAGETKTFPSPAGKCLNGSLAFGDYPQCGNAAAPDGYSTAEWTLNTPSGAWEALDISLVNGFNGYIEIQAPGNEWFYGPNRTPTNQIVNHGLGQNIGNPGVFPYSCTDCIQLVGNQPCSFPPFSGKCQTQRICNLQRSTGPGGTVTISWHGHSPPTSP